MSFTDIDQLDGIDARQRTAVIEAIERAREIDRIVWKLAIAEAVQVANIGSQYDKQGQNARAYTKWQRDQVRAINRLQRVKTGTVWDKMSRKSRKI